MMTHPNGLYVSTFLYFTGISFLVTLLCDAACASGAKVKVSTTNKQTKNQRYRSHSPPSPALPAPLPQTRNRTGCLDVGFLLLLPPQRAAASLPNSTKTTPLCTDEVFFVLFCDYVLLPVDVFPSYFGRLRWYQSEF